MERSGGGRGAATVGVWALTVALSASVGCEATTMSAQGAPVPVLVGPVACIGCAPSASEPMPNGIRIEDRSMARYMAGGGSTVTASVWQKGVSTLGHKVAAVVRDPCRIDIRVSKLTASGLGVFAVAFAMATVDVQVDATTAVVANGSCPPLPRP